MHKDIKRAWVVKAYNLVFVYKFLEKGVVEIHWTDPLEDILGIDTCLASEIYEMLGV
jgi:hypothetical protein